MLFIAINITVNMGSENSLLGFTHDEITEYREINRKYQKRLVSMRKKTIGQFQSFLRTIQKRLTYLKYPWANQLCHFIQTETHQKFYLQYKCVLKQNCLRKGVNENVLCPQSIRKEFINGFIQNYGKKTSNKKSKAREFIDENTNPIKSTKQFSNQNSKQQKKKPQRSEQAMIDQAFEECKCYFMVISWLWQLVTFSDLHDPENQDGFNFFMKEEEIIYRILTDLLVKHAEKFLRTPVHSIVSDRLLIKYCKVFNVNAPFREKEFLLKLVIKQLDKCDKFEQNINALFYAFGIANSYALLKIMKELSAIDVSRVWTAILSYDGRDTRI